MDDGKDMEREVEDTDESINLDQKFKEVMENVKNKTKRPQNNMFGKRSSYHLRPSMIDRALPKTKASMATSTPMPFNRKLSFTPEKEAVSPINTASADKQKNTTESNKPESIIVVSSDSSSLGTVTPHREDGVSSRIAPLTPPQERRVNSRQLNKSLPNLPLKKSNLEKHVQRLSKSAEKSRSNKMVQTSLSNRNLNLYKKLARNSVKAVGEGTETQTGPSLNRNFLAVSRPDSLSSTSSAMSSFLRQCEDDEVLIYNQVKSKVLNEEPSKSCVDVAKPWRAPNGLKTINIPTVNSGCINDSDLSVDDTFLPKPPPKKKVFVNKKKKRKSGIKSVKTRNKPEGDDDKTVRKNTPARKSRNIVAEAPEEVAAEKSTNEENRQDEESYDINLNRQSAKVISSGDDKIRMPLNKKRQDDARFSEINLNVLEAIANDLNEIHHEILEEMVNEPITATTARIQECSKQFREVYNKVLTSVKKRNGEKPTIVPPSIIFQSSRNEKNNAVEKNCNESVVGTRRKSPRKIGKNVEDSVSEHKESPKKPKKSSVLNERVEDSTVVPQQEVEVVFNDSSSPRKQSVDLEDIEKNPKKLIKQFTSHLIKKRSEVPTVVSQVVTNETTSYSPTREMIDTMEPSPCISQPQVEVEKDTQTWNMTEPCAVEEKLKKTTKRPRGRPRRKAKKSPKQLKIAVANCVDNKKLEESRMVSDVATNERTRSKTKMPRENSDTREESSLVPQQELETGEKSPRKLNTTEKACCVVIEKLKKPMVLPLQGTSKRTRGRPRKKRSPKKLKNAEADNIVNGTLEGSVFVSPLPVDKGTNNKSRQTRNKSVVKEAETVPLEVSFLTNDMLKESPMDGGTTTSERIEETVSDLPSEGTRWCRSRKTAVSETLQESVLSGKEINLESNDKPKGTKKNTIQQSRIRNPKRKSTLERKQSARKREKEIDQMSRMSTISSTLSNALDGSSRFSENSTLRRSGRERRPAPGAGSIIVICTSNKEYNREIMKSARPLSNSRRTSSTSRSRITVSTFRENGRAISPIAEVVEEVNDYGGLQTSQENYNNNHKAKSILSGRVSKKGRKKSTVKKALGDIMNVSRNLSTDNEGSSKSRKVRHVLDICDNAKIRDRNVMSHDDPGDDLEMVDGVGVVITFDDPIDGISWGILKVAPGKCKPKQTTKKHKMIFQVEEGKAEVEIGKAKKVYPVRRVFSVPKGCNYLIRNLHEKDHLLLYFTRVRS